MWGGRKGGKDGVKERKGGKGMKRKRGARRGRREEEGRREEGKRREGEGTHAIRSGVYTYTILYLKYSSLLPRECTDILTLTYF